MVLKLMLDLDRCSGCACCMIECPDLFDIDDETGLSVLKDPAPSDARFEEAERAVRSCPENAIALERF